MGKYHSQLTERILNITLEIIFLLTGEEYGPVEKANENLLPISNLHVSEEPAAHSLTHEKSNKHKILKLTNKIIGLLTGEVPIRCQDVAVYFSMEEWEYLEGHKDLYKDTMITLPDLPPYEFEEFYTPVSSPVYMKNEHSYPMKEEVSPSVGEHNMTIHWDTAKKKATSYKAKCPSSSICLPTGDIKQGTPINNRGLCNETGPKNYINYLRPLFLDHAYPITARSNLLLVEGIYFTDSGIPTPTIHTPEYLTSQFKEEPNLHDGELLEKPKLQDGKSLTYSDLHTPAGPIQYTTVHVKDETDDLQEYQCSHIKVEPISCDVPNLTDTGFHTSTDLKEGPISIKEEPVSYDSFENTDIYTPMYHTQQYTAHHFQEEWPSETDIYLPTDTLPSNSSKAEIDIYLPTDTHQSKDVHRKRVQQHKLLDKPFLCTECGKRFQCKSGLSTHKKIHMFRKRHSCTECGKSFLSHPCLVKHQKIHSGEKPYSCEECGKSFLKASNLTVHQKVHGGEGPFSCDICEKRFLTNSNLIQHQKIHELPKPLSCRECDKWFSSKSELIDHRRLHSGDKTFSCPDCGKSFIKVQNLLNHQRLHTGKNPFSCIECGKLFTSNTYLIRHMELHTRKKTSYPCPICGKYFNSNLDLIIHQRIHSGGKSGTNSEWRKCFIRKLGFVIHQRNHAKQKSFSCPECKEQFVKKIHLFHHRKVHREEKSMSA